MDVNIKDIARISGVGISTVSRVINNKGLVSKATREKVLSVVREYNYVPNSNARNLKTTESKNIALMVKGITNPFFSNMIKEIERQVNLRGYPFLIQQVEDGTDEIKAAIQLVKEKNLCGIIFMGGTYNHSEEKFKQLTIPFVLTTITSTQKVDPSVFSSVIIDELKEAYKATNYLISLGHTNIGFLAKSPLLDETTGNRRHLGYKKHWKSIICLTMLKWSRIVNTVPAPDLMPRVDCSTRIRELRLFLQPPTPLRLVRPKLCLPPGCLFRATSRSLALMVLRWLSIFTPLWIQSANRARKWHYQAWAFSLTSSRGSQTTSILSTMRYCSNVALAG